MMDHGQSPESAFGDAEPLDIASLSHNMQQEIARQLHALERQKLRAAVLFQRLAAHGLDKEAETLGVRYLYENTADSTAKLDALERIVGTLEFGPMLELRAALRTGAGTQAAMHLLSRIQNPESAAAVGERYALAVICESDEREDALDFPADAGRSVLEAVEGAEETLLNRLELVQEALHRLRAAGARAAPVQ